MSRTITTDLLKRKASSIPLLPKSPFSNQAKPDIELTKNEHLKAALHLLNDDIHECHEKSQAHDGDPEFDLLHSILHRREGDFWNSQWWIGRLRSPLLIDIYGGKNMTEAKSNAKDFVRRVEQWHNHSSDRQEENALLEYQYRELSTIVQHFSGDS